MPSSDLHPRARVRYALWESPSHTLTRYGKDHDPLFVMHYKADNTCHTYDTHYTPGVMRVFITRANTLLGATYHNTRTGRVRTILNTMLKG